MSDDMLLEIKVQIKELIRELEPLGMFDTCMSLLRVLDEISRFEREHRPRRLKEAR